MPQFTQEELLAIRVTGEQEVKRLREEIRLMEEDLVKAYQARDGSIQKEVAWRQAVQLSAPILAKNREEIEKFSEASKVGLAKYGQNITALGYALNDFFSVSGNVQQRLNAIANNLPAVFAGFGGLGLALGALTPIVAALVPMIEKFWQEVDEAKSKVEQLKDRIKELEEKPHKLSIDTLELENARKEVERLTEGLKAYEAFGKRRSEEQKGVGGEVRDILDLAPEGYAGVQGKLRSSLVQKAEASSQTLQETEKSLEKWNADLQRLLDSPLGPDEDLSTRAAQIDTARKQIGDLQEKRKNTRAKIAEESKAQVGEAVTKAESGENVAPLAQLLNDAGMTGLGEMVGKTTPESVKAENRARRDAEKDRAANKAKAQFKEDEEQGQKGLDEAVRQGQEAEQKARRKKQIDDAKDNQKKAEEAAKKQEKDRADLEKGLGNDFLTRAEAARLGIENDPNTSEAQKRQARLKFGADFQEAAYRRLLAGGMPGDRAAELSQGAGGFVQDDIQKQLDMLRAQGGPANRADAMRQLQGILQGQPPGPAVNAAEAPEGEALNRAFMAVNARNAQLEARLKAFEQVAGRNAQSIQQDALMWQAQQFQTYPFNSWLGN